jgi:hypothetical protein
MNRILELGHLPKLSMVFNPLMVKDYKFKKKGNIARRNIYCILENLEGAFFCVGN